jgi:hypothetical protein
MDWLRDFPFQKAPSYCILISAPALHSGKRAMASDATTERPMNDLQCSRECKIQILTLTSDRIEPGVNDFGGTLAQWHHLNPSLLQTACSYLLLCRA